MTEKLIGIMHEQTKLRMADRVIIQRRTRSHPYRYQEDFSRGIASALAHAFQWGAFGWHTRMERLHQYYERLEDGRTPNPYPEP